MENLEVRVRRAIDDLNVILGELHVAGSDEKENGIVAQIKEIDLVLAQEFKSMVDTLRTLLWCQISAAKQGHGRGQVNEEALDSLRMYRAVDLVRHHAPRLSAQRF
jgi:hypothetical protein